MKHTYILLIISLLYLGNSFAQGTCASAEVLHLDPCSEAQYTITITNTNDGQNSSSCGYDGNEAYWIKFVVPSTFPGAPIGYVPTGIYINIADWGGCGGLFCYTDITAALYKENGGGSCSLDVVDDCIDLSSGLFNSYQGPWTYAASPGDVFYYRVSEENNDGGWIDFEISLDPLPGQTPNSPNNLVEASGLFCNYTAAANDCPIANSALSCIGTIDNSVFYSFDVTLGTVFPLSFGFAEIQCNGAMQMAVVSPDCSSTVYGAVCGITNTAEQISFPTAASLPVGSYLLVVDGVAGDNCSWSLDVPINLPVELFAFDGYSEGKTNILEWVTASEENSSHFEIERSADGRSFNIIEDALLPAQGTSTSKIDYSYIDVTPFKGDNYYRLKVVDRDESYEYSDIIHIRQDNELSIKSIAPNPVIDLVNINFNSKSDVEISYFISDLVGKKLDAGTFNATEGNNSTELNLENLSQGIYILSLFDGFNMVNEKIVIGH